MIVPNPEHRDDLYTAGELAKLFNIPKQTLLYYDKMGLLEPEFVEDNSYRYYTIKQYMILEIIVNMRKLDLPITVIKEYLQNRSLDHFEKLIQAKQEECDEIIRRNLAIKDNLELAKRKITTIRQTQFDNFTMEYRQARQLYITPLTPEDSPRQRIDSYAQHNIHAYANHQFKERSTGWAMEPEDFLGGNFSRSLFYYSPLTEEFDDEEAIDSQHLQLRPAGLYLTLRCQGTFHNLKEKMSEMFKEFLIRNNLEISGNFYIEPLKDHWMSTEANTYINQVSVAVHYKK